MKSSDPTTTSVTPPMHPAEIEILIDALVLVDGAQAVPHLPVDVAALGCDFYAFSGHKMCGATGIGGLWGRRSVLEAMSPFHGGGEMIRVFCP